MSDRSPGKRLCGQRRQGAFSGDDRRWQRRVQQLKTDTPTVKPVGEILQLLDQDGRIKRPNIPVRADHRRGILQFLHQHWQRISTGNSSTPQSMLAI